MNARSLFVGFVVLATVAPATARAQALDGTQGSSGPAPAQPEALPWQLSKLFPINVADPEASLPSKRQRDRNPMEFGYLLQDLLEGAELARKDGDYYGVIRYYRAVVKAVPERAKSWSKLCEAYAIVNDHGRASKACGTALSLPGVELQDYSRFVHETLLKSRDVSAEDRGKIKDVLAHLDQQPNVEFDTSQVRCEVGVATGDSRMLEICTAALTRLAPNDPRTVVYQWTLEMQRGHTEAAARLLQRAKALKLPSNNIERMEALTASEHGRGYLWKGLGAVFFLLAAGGALVLARRRRAQLALAAR